jgi:hypothetical protein
VRRVLPGLLFVVCAFCPATSLRARSPGQSIHAPSGGTRAILSSISIPPIPNAPFTATVNTQWVRTLEDGTSVTLQNRRTIARDNGGRIFQERRGLFPPNDPREDQIRRLDLANPLGHTIDYCWPQMRLCRVWDYYGRAVVPPPLPEGPFDDGKAVLTRVALGTDSIDGLDVIGTCETTTILPGTIGNDQAVQIVKEFWYSPHLGINLVEKRQDPRFGTQTFTVTNLSLGEPDASFFSLPAGFRVVDMRTSPKRAVETHGSD